MRRCKGLRRSTYAFFGGTQVERKRNSRLSVPSAFHLRDSCFHGSGTRKSEAWQGFSGFCSTWDTFCRYKRCSAALWLQCFDQGGAALGHVAPGSVEVAGIPGVGHFLSGAVSVVQEQAKLVLLVPAGNPLHVADVGAVHADNQIVLIVIGSGHLSA